MGAWVRQATRQLERLAESRMQLTLAIHESRRNHSRGRNDTGLRIRCERRPSSIPANIAEGLRAVRPRGSGAILQRSRRARREELEVSTSRLSRDLGYCAWSDVLWRWSRALDEIGRDAARRSGDSESAEKADRVRLGGRVSGLLAVRLLVSVWSGAATFPRSLRQSRPSGPGRSGGRLRASPRSPSSGLR